MRKTLAGLLGLALLGLGAPAERADAGATADLLFGGRNGARMTPTHDLRRVLRGLGAPAERAAAGATVALLFVGRNGARITPTDNVRVGEDVRIGDLLTLAIRLRNDIPLTVVVFSLRYDLDGADELDVSS